MTTLSPRFDCAVVRLDQAGGSLEIALHRFKSGCQAAGIFEEIKKRRFYMTPGVRRRAKAAKAAARRARAERRRRENSIDWKPAPAPRA